jgi:hypothetical protein
MKWWYVLVIFLGIVLGLVLLSNNRKINKDNLTIVNRAGLKGEVANLPTIMTTSNKGEKKNTHQLTGVVESWSPENGLIEVKAAGKIWQFYLDPVEMMIFIPSIKNKNQILMVSNKEGSIALVSSVRSLLKGPALAFDRRSPIALDIGV